MSSQTQCIVSFALVAQPCHAQVKTKGTSERKAVFLGGVCMLLFRNGIPYLVVHGIICSFISRSGNYTARGVLLHSSTLCIGLTLCYCVVMAQEIVLLAGCLSIWYLWFNPAFS